MFRGGGETYEPEDINTSWFTNLLIKSEKKAWVTLFRYRHAWLVGCAADSGRHPQDCEDAAQETWTRVYAFRRNLNPRRSLSPLLKTICLNVCRDDGKKNRPHPMDELVQRIEEQGDAEEIDEERIRSAVSKLQRLYREVIEMKYEMHLSTREIAELLCVSTETVHKRLSRAYEMLRKWLRDEK